MKILLSRTHWVSSRFITIALFVWNAFQANVRSAIYLTEWTPHPQKEMAFKRANRDGTGVVTLAAGLENFTGPRGLSIDQANGHIYVTDGVFSSGRGQGILRYNLDGSGRKVVIPPVPSATYQAAVVAGSRLYFTQWGVTGASNALLSATLDGSEIVSLASGLKHFVWPAGVAVDIANGYVFVADGGPNGQGVVRYGLNGDGRAVVIPARTGYAYTNVCVAGGKLYSIMSRPRDFGGVLVRSNLDGTDLIVLANSSKPNGLAVDPAAGYIYVTESVLASGLLRFKLDGSDRTLLVPAEVGFFNGVAFTSDNRPPELRADPTWVLPSAGGTIAVGDLLSNDSDPDGDPFFLREVVSPTEKGAHVTFEDQRIRYMPAAGFTGRDEVRYTVSDDRGGDAGGRIEVEVQSDLNQPPAIESIRILSRGNLFIRIAAKPLTSYRLESVSSLGPNGLPWTTLMTFVTDVSGVQDLIQPVESEARFFRISLALPDPTAAKAPETQQYAVKRFQSSPSN
jgi:DNA-binding beta-propeller fold protein YncE